MNGEQRFTAVRFIIITVPPVELSTALEAARDDAAAMTGSYAALAYPPHVTLRTGALVPLRSVDEFAAGTRAALGPWEPFPMRTDGLFHAPYEDHEGKTRHMVGWRIVKDPALMELHRRLLGFDRFQRRAQPFFEPHLTLAFDDIGGEDAERLLLHARAHPSIFPPDLCWTCTNVGLYRQIEGCWQPYYEFRVAEPVR